jgi:hypothetical protein
MVVSLVIGCWGAGGRRRLEDRGIVGAYSPENRGAEQQRVVCTLDVLRLSFWEISDVHRIVVCLRFYPRGHSCSWTLAPTRVPADRGRAR